MLALLIELLWALPVVGFIFLLRLKLVRWRESIWVVLIGASIGALYAYVIALLAGPAVQAPALPFLPVAMTCGAVGGVIPLGRNGLASRKHSMFVCFALVLTLWIAFFKARVYFQKKESFRLVVIKLSPEPKPLHWAKGTSFISLKREEIEEAEKATGTASLGVMMPVDLFTVGPDANATVILVMQRDVSDRIRLPMPDRGLVVYVQNADGSWQNRASDVNSHSLVLSPTEGTGFTRIEIEDALGSTATEVRLSQK